MLSASCFCRTLSTSGTCKTCSEVAAIWERGGGEEKEVMSSARTILLARLS